MSFFVKFVPAFLCVITFSVQAQDLQLPVVSSDETESIGLKTEAFLDTTAALDWKAFTVPSRKFAAAHDDVLNFGPTSDACWIRFQYSPTDANKHFLEVGNSNLGLIDYYVVSKDSLLAHVQGGYAGTDAKKILTLNKWLFELPHIAAGEVVTIYLRVMDLRRVIVPMRITDFNTSVSASQKTDFLFGLYFGCIGIIAVLNVFFFLYFQERIYIYYSFHILTQILINGIIKGYLFTLFGSSLYLVSPYLAGLAGVSNICFILFSVAFLEIRKLSPKWYLFCQWLMLLPFINIVLNISGLFTFAAIAGTYIGMIVCVSLFVMGVWVYRQRVTQARFFIIGWGAFFLGLVILNFALNDWLPVNAFTYNAAVYGTLLEVLLISSAQADRINVVRLEREVERLQRIQLVEQQNAWLEQNVMLRTHELTQKNNEIEAQNEELKQQHEELSTTHELLEKQKQVVEAKSIEIENINQGLELKVQQRTLELEETVKSLIRQNHDLEQFSYIVSHNLRAPVSRILGLIHLMEIEKMEESEQRVFIQYLKESTLGLDQIIHDLNHIIAVRKGLDTIMESVDLGKVIRHIKADLTDEIERTEAEVVTAVAVKEIFSVKSYVQSILYNLLSNALKYRSPERKLVIKIDIREENGFIVFRVADNGLGIKLPKERLQEVFQLYKRLHTHVQGKGLGLYLVKTQVDGLHGTIDIESEDNVGTTVVVRIPITR